MDYIIYESAFQSPVENVQNLNSVVEFETVLQEANHKNRNGRIYPKEIIEAGLQSPIIQEKLRTHSWMFEAGHPFSTDMSRQTTIDMRNIAGLIEEVWWDGDLLKARCKTADTAIGRDMAGLIREGCQVSFSLRAQGNVARDSIRDALVVQSPLMIITYDWVFLPSHDKAYMEKICEETIQAMADVSQYSKTNLTVSAALNEACNLYESGQMFKSQEVAKKKYIDYTKDYSSNFSAVNETYKFDKNDYVTKIEKGYVILENASTVKKVNKQEYLSEAIRCKIKESVGDVAPVFSNALSAKNEAVTEPISTAETLAKESGLDNNGIAQAPTDISTEVGATKKEYDQYENYDDTDAEEYKEEDCKCDECIKKLDFLIKDEHEAIDGYNESIKFFTECKEVSDEKKDSIVKQLEHIKSEEEEHIKELEELKQLICTKDDHAGALETKDGKYVWVK